MDRVGAGFDDKHRDDEDRSEAPCSPDDSQDNLPDDFQSFFEGLDQKADQSRKQRPQKDGLEPRDGKLQPGSNGDRTAAQRLQNLMKEGHVEEGGKEHRHQINGGANPDGHRFGVESGHRGGSIASMSDNGLGHEQASADGFPVLTLVEVVAGALKCYRSDHESKDYESADEAQDGKDEKFLVLQHHRDGTFKQNPASLQFVHGKLPFFRFLASKTARIDIGCMGSRL